MGARRSRRVSRARQMPPWHIDRSIGEYADDPSLTDQEIATIAAWIDGGAPQGNPADAPPPLKFSPLDEWVLGEPDLVVEMEKGFTIPATGPDFTPEEVVDPEDHRRPLREVGADHSDRALLRAPLACLRRAAGRRRTPKGSGSGWDRTRTTRVDLIEYAAGNDADMFADGTAKMIQGRIEVPLLLRTIIPTARRCTTSQKVGHQVLSEGLQAEIRRHLAPDSHRRRQRLGPEPREGRGPDPAGGPQARHQRAGDADRRAGRRESAARRGVAEHSAQHVARHERFWPLPKPALIISFQPHMHFRGTRMTLEAIHPDGRREMLTDATHYEQNWQITYTYKTPHLFPAGTILHTVSWHDNTANNKHNPDPTAWIGWGSRTMDEMGHGWTDIAFLTEEQYQEELAKRNAQKKPLSTNNQQQRLSGPVTGRTRGRRRRSSRTGLLLLHFPPVFCSRIPLFLTRPVARHRPWSLSMRVITVAAVTRNGSRPAVFLVETQARAQPIGQSPPRDPPPPDPPPPAACAIASSVRPAAK